MAWLLRSVRARPGRPRATIVEEDARPPPKLPGKAESGSWNPVKVDGAAQPSQNYQDSVYKKNSWQQEKSCCSFKAINRMSLFLITSAKTEAAKSLSLSVRGSLGAFCRSCTEQHFTVEAE